MVVGDRLGIGCRGVVLVGLALAIACVQPPARSEQPEGPIRLAVLEADYGAAIDRPAAIEPGDRLDTLELPLADGGQFTLARALAAGPVILVWIGGAEHEGLMAWVRALDAGLAALEQRSATLVFVRPLEPDAALRWATQMHVQTPVAADPRGDLGVYLDLAAELAQPLEFAVLIVRDGELAYRKLGGRRPALDELLAVVDDEAGALRCCPSTCVGPSCLQPD
jgi:hypothetical protein